MAKTGMGTCPKCGSDNISYYDMDFDGDLIIHQCECNDCHLEFREYEKTIFDGYSYDDEDGHFCDFDGEGKPIVANTGF